MDLYVKIDADFLIENVDVFILEKHKLLLWQCLKMYFLFLTFKLVP